MHIVVVCGTNRTGALSRTLSQRAAEAYTALGHSVDLLDMADAPADMISGDSYKNQSDAVKEFVGRFLKSDGVVFVVPEYNGSYPGILKLFVDMLPFPEGFDNRPCAFIGLAAGQFKSLRAVEHFQQVAGYRNAYQYPRRLFIGESFKQFDEDGQLVDGDLADRLKQQAEGFAAFASAVKA